MTQSSSDSPDTHINKTALLQHFDSLEVAEDYGVLCGMLCLLDESSAGALWREHSSLVEIADTDSRPLLEHLILQTHANLYSDEYDFELVLPEDSDSLQMRLYALSNYCRGFLTGLGMAGLDRIESLSDDVQAFIKDLGVLSQGAIETSHSEQDEADYVEITEYIRAGTMLVAREKQQIRDKRTVH